MDTVLIPAGEFLMGSDPHKDKDAYDDEQPQHTVTLPDYYIGKTPVTNTQYLAFVEATGHRKPRHWENGQIPAGKQDHPVVYVSWEDAVAYCGWLAELAGKPYRLPTEAEWEKAARGTDGRIYPWGNQVPTDKLCNFNHNVDDTTPVGKYSPQGDSPYGCADMAGNVFEWASLDVLRGGAFYGNDRFVRCAYRYGDYPSLRNCYVGFRVAMTLMKKEGDE